MPYLPMAAWPIGYFRSYSGWLLRHRRTIATRVSTLDAEINRIGFVDVQYNSVSDDRGEIRTGEKIGMSVTSGSTLEKLLQAYIANGGNPFAISDFMYPRTTTITIDEDGYATRDERYPSSGVVFPLSDDPNDPLPINGESGYGASTGGMLNSRFYYPARQGGRVSPGSYDHGALTKSMHQMRSWANQDIKEVLNDMESRIIKQCDLREQLVKERDEVLVQAFGGVLSGIQDIDVERFDTNLLVQNLYQDVAVTIFEKAQDGVSLVPTHRSDAYLLFTFPSTPEDFTDSM